MEGSASDSDDAPVVPKSRAVSLKGAKRAKLSTRDDEDNSDGNSEAEQEQEDEDEEGEDGTRPNGGGGHDDDSVSASGDGASPNAMAIDDMNVGGGPAVQHRPGAIVRVKLRDFVTYRSAEFFPGPRLNMVIGPNGTGKSTLVCAICLGLGWSPQVCL